MFYYYGRKKKISGLYPEPMHGVIVEPFAGSASYSLHGNRWRRDVVLVERDPDVAALWRWLIGTATRSDVFGLPDPVEGERTDSFLHILHMASKRAFTYRSATATPFMLDAWRASKAYMAENVHKVKHWTLIEGDYTAAPDVEATWFIDPPYQGDAGTGCRYGSALLDYGALGSWVRGRRGHVMACDAPTATWLPFRPWAGTMAHAGRRSLEGLYEQGGTAFDVSLVDEMFG